MDLLRYSSEGYEDNPGNCQVIINSMQTSGSRMGVAQEDTRKEGIGC